MKLHDFYRRFEDLPRDARFAMIGVVPEPSSFFVIFQQLSQVRQQKRFFEDREEHLLKVAEEAFKKYDEKYKKEYINEHL
jgi:hypothetical protein